MAILVTNGSLYCRSCGHQTVQRDGFTWCANDRETMCRQLNRIEREFCERCGCPAPGGIVCRRCRQPALVP